MFGNLHQFPLVVTWIKRISRTLRSAYHFLDLRLGGGEGRGQRSSPRSCSSQNRTKNKDFRGLCVYVSVCVCVRVCVCVYYIIKKNEDFKKKS